MGSRIGANKDLTIYDPRKLKRDAARVDRGFWRKFRRVVGKIPFAEELLATYFAAVDRKTPTYVRAALLGALAYFVVPLDMLPDFIVGFGFIDDASVLAATIAAVRGHIKDAHFDEARNWLESWED